MVEFGFRHMGGNMSRSDKGPERSVLVVDDSLFMRRMVSDMIERFPGYHVVATAADGEEALRMVERHDPDLVTLDIEMPRLDGFGVLERIMSTRPRPCVVLSAYTATGSEAALRALELGAVEFVAKPSGPISFDVAKVEGRLFEALQAASAADLEALLEERRGEITRAVAIAEEGGEAAVVIAASTGGPRALTFLLGALPDSLEAAVLVVQHMPAGFTSTLAARLDEICKLPVKEATGGEKVFPNQVWLAPGNFHMRLRRFNREVHIALDQRQPLWGTRPAADALFPTAAAVYGQRCIGVVLTGMGRDGADGLGAIRAASGHTIVQDEATSVVFGMPGRAIEQGVAERVVPLDEIPDAIVEYLSAILSGARGVK
jgi:two-component system chemotaxis response regulator CheB